MQPGVPGHGRLPRGWYNDPWGPGLRYWDGEAWTALSGTPDDGWRGPGSGGVLAVLGLLVVGAGALGLWWLTARAEGPSPADAARAGTLQVEDLPLGWARTELPSPYADRTGAGAVGYATLPAGCRAAVDAGAAESTVRTDAASGSPVYTNGSRTDLGIAVGAGFVLADDDTARRLLESATGSTARACLAEDLANLLGAGVGVGPAPGALTQDPGSSYADESVHYRVVQEVQAPAASTPQSVVADVVLMRAGRTLVHVVLAGTASALPAAEREVALSAVARRIADG